MNQHQPADPQKAQCPGGAGQGAEETQSSESSVPQRPTPLKPSYPGDYADPAEWAAFMRLDYGLRQEIEEAHYARARANRSAVEHYTKTAFSYAAGVKREQRVWCAPGVNRFESHLGSMPFELAPVPGRPNKVVWISTTGNLAGYASRRALSDAPKHIMLDESGISRNFLFDGRFLMPHPAARVGVLDPHDLTSREDYATRFSLSMSLLGAPRVRATRLSDSSLSRVRAWAEGGAT